MDRLYLTSLIKPGYLKVDHNVTAYYQSLAFDNTIELRTSRRHTAAGRPSRYGTKTKTIRVPEELADTLKKALDEWALDPENRTVICITSQNTNGL